MSQGLASPPPISAGPAFIARRPRWGPPRDIGARPSRGTRHSSDVAAPSVAVVLHWLQHATGPLAAATTNGPTDSARPRQIPRNNCRSCKHEYGTCMRKLLFVAYAVDCLAPKRSKSCSRLGFARVIETLRGRTFRCAVTDYPGTGKDGPHSDTSGNHLNKLHGSDRCSAATQLTVPDWWWHGSAHRWRLSARSLRAPSLPDCTEHVVRIPFSSLDHRCQSP